MKLTFFGKFCAAFSLLACTISVVAEDTPAAVTALIPVIAKWGENPVLIAAVKEQNAKNVTLEQIQKRDKEWMATTGLDDGMKAIMKSPAAKELEKLEATQTYFFESFLMDQLGANVAMTNKTSDYWQGDEPKFMNAYKAGTGGTDIGKSKFDDSAKAYLIQISVPVKEGSKVIGAITVGINLDELDKAK
ncbi:MAG: hypothetical protein V4660_00585 [Pseudomonadota bacterium]